MSNSSSRWVHARARMGLATVALLALAGCSGVSVESVAESGRPAAALTAPSPASEGALGAPAAPASTFSSALSWTHTTTDCPLLWQGLTIPARSLSELVTIAPISFCTLNWSQLKLKNNGQAVWTVKLPSWSTPVMRGNIDPVGASFRRIVGQSIGQVMLTPGDTVQIEAWPGALTMEIRPDLTLAWESHSSVLGELSAMVDDHIDDALQGRGTRGAALAQCTWSGYMVGKKLATWGWPISTDDTTSLLKDTYGVGNDLHKCWKASKAVRATSQSDDLAQRLGGRVLNQPAKTQLRTVLTQAQSLLKVALS